METVGRWKVVIVIALLAIMSVTAFCASPESDSLRAEIASLRSELIRLKEMLSVVYSPSGEPRSFGIEGRGMRRISGSTKLTSGVDTVEIGDATSPGRQDVGFLSDTTFGGKAWGTKVSQRGKVYSVIPIGPRKFVVTSSDTADTATVRFSLEGE